MTRDFCLSSTIVPRFFLLLLQSGRTLSCMNNTLVRSDPTETPRTVELRVWYDTEGKSLDLPDLSKGAEMGSRPGLSIENQNEFDWFTLVRCFQ